MACEFYVNNIFLKTKRKAPRIIWKTFAPSRIYCGVSGEAGLSLSNTLAALGGHSSRKTPWA